MSRTIGVSSGNSLVLRAAVQFLAAAPDNALAPFATFVSRVGAP
jgi:hypothetical protein